MFEMRDLLLLGIMESKLPLAIAIQSLKGEDNSNTWQARARR